MFTTETWTQRTFLKRVIKGDRLSEESAQSSSQTWEEIIQWVIIRESNYRDIPMNSSVRNMVLTFLSITWEASVEVSSTSLATYSEIKHVRTINIQSFYLLYWDTYLIDWLVHGTIHLLQRVWAIEINYLLYVVFNIYLHRVSEVLRLAIRETSLINQNRVLYGVFVSQEDDAILFIWVN